MHELPSPRVVSLPSLCNGTLHDSGLTQMPLLSGLQAGQMVAIATEWTAILINKSDTRLVWNSGITG